MPFPRRVAAALVAGAGAAGAFTVPALPTVSRCADATVMTMRAGGARPPAPLLSRREVAAAVLGCVLAVPLRSEAKKGGKGDGVTALSGLCVCVCVRARARAHAARRRGAPWRPRLLVAPGLLPHLPFPLALAILPHPRPNRRGAPPGADPADKAKLEEAAKVIDSLEGLLSDPAQWYSVSWRPRVLPCSRERR